MYIKDGIAYAGEATPELEVASARYVGNLQMVVTFAGGEERLLDATELSDMPALAPLMDEKVLEDFSIDHGVLTWLGGEIDIAPEAAYRRSFEYPPARRDGGASAIRRARRIGPSQASAEAFRRNYENDITLLAYPPAFFSAGRTPSGGA